jgi:integrase
MSKRLGPFLYSHGKGFKYLRHVPDDLRAVVKTKTWVETFDGTVSRREAERQRDALALKHRALIDKLRVLSVDERDDIATRGGVGGLQSFIADVERGPAFVQTLPPDADDDGPVSMQSVLDSFNALQVLDAEVAEAQRGKRTLAKISPEKGILSLHDLWKATAKPRSFHSVESMRRCLQRLIGVVGDMVPKNVTSDHAAKYRDHLETEPNLKPRTRRKYLEEVKTAFNVAASKRVIDGNPFRDIKLGKTGGKFSDRESRASFQPHHVRAVFEALSSEHLDFQWVTKLFAYHGGRSGEFAQLRKEDVTTSFGVTVLRLHDEHGSIKNEQSVRTIPLHPACADFVRYAEAAEGPWIFASFPVWKEGRRGAAYQRRAADFIRKVLGIADKRLTMHSLRHTWRTLAREIDMPEDVSRAIMGHTLGKGEHAKYGDASSLKKQLKWLKKIDPLKG